MVCTRLRGPSLPRPGDSRALIAYAVLGGPPQPPEAALTLLVDSRYVTLTRNEFHWISLQHLGTHSAALGCLGTP